MRDNLLPSEEMSKALEAIMTQMRSGTSEAGTSEAGTSETASDLVGSLMRHGMAHILQESLEEEVTDFLGRGHYERSEEPVRRGYRNGYTDKTVRTTEGRLRLRRPRVRDTEEPFESAVLGRLEALEERLHQMAVRAGALHARHRRDAHRRAWPGAALQKRGKPPHRAAL